MQKIFGNDYFLSVTVITKFEKWQISIWDKYVEFVDF